MINFNWLEKAHQAIQDEYGDEINIKIIERMSEKTRYYVYKLITSGKKIEAEKVMSQYRGIKKNHSFSANQYIINKNING